MNFQFSVSGSFQSRILSTLFFSYHSSIYHINIPSRFCVRIIFINLSRRRIYSHYLMNCLQNKQKIWKKYQSILYVNWYVFFYFLNFHIKTTKKLRKTKQLKKSNIGISVYPCGFDNYFHFGSTIWQMRESNESRILLAARTNERNWSLSPEKNHNLKEWQKTFSKKIGIQSPEFKE